MKDDPQLPMAKKELTVVVTDSGLGGLAVMDDLRDKLSRSGMYKKVQLIFVNALFDPDRGYNALPTREAKIDTFNRVLSGIEKTFHPDVILVGCNTLSVLLDETDFVKRSSTPVLGIVDAGVKMIADALRERPHSKVIITGTETTISEGSHRQALLEMGFPDSAIITQACPELQSYIERDPQGDDTRMLISVYTEEALSDIHPGDRVFLSLNCSHFGYSIPLWEEAARQAGIQYEGILDPNIRMGEALIPLNPLHRYRKTKISFRVVSKVPLKNRDAISGFFDEKSPDLAHALEQYKIDKDLF